MADRLRTGAVLYAKDMHRLARFYSRVAGLDICETQADYVVLGCPGFQLVVLRIPQRIAQSIEIAQPPVRRETTPIKLVFVIESIAVARAHAAVLGGTLDPADREWRFEGRVVCDGHDPEGNVFQLRQAAN